MHIHTIRNRKKDILISNIDSVLSVPDDIQTVTTGTIEIANPFSLFVQAQIIESLIGLMEQQIINEIVR